MFYNMNGSQFIKTILIMFQDGEESVPSWELRVEGRLLEDVSVMFI